MKYDASKMTTPVTWLSLRSYSTARFTTTQVKLVKNIDGSH